MLPPSQVDELRRFAAHLADVAGEVVRAAWARPGIEVETKADGSPVTVADREAERAMRAEIARVHPGLGIVGEEYGPDHADADLCWVLDPIDGTKSFVSRVPLFAILVGLRFRGQPLLGVIDQPILRERAEGDGRSATLNGRPVRVAEVPLGEAVVVTTDAENIRRHHPWADWQGLAADCGFVRTWGDGYGHLMLASGRAHLMADPVMNPWDLVPVLPVLRGAGATVTSWDGGDPVAAGNILAAAPALHAAALRRLRG